MQHLRRWFTFTSMMDFERPQRRRAVHWIMLASVFVNSVGALPTSAQSEASGSRHTSVGESGMTTKTLQMSESEVTEKEMSVSHTSSQVTLCGGACSQYSPNKIDYHDEDVAVFQNIMNETACCDLCVAHNANVAVGENTGNTNTNCTIAVW
jgi:hypothetical protein